MKLSVDCSLIHNLLLQFGVIIGATVVFVCGVCAFGFFWIPCTDLWFGQCNG